MQVTKTSILTGVTRTRDLPITEEQLRNWKNGQLIQHAFPHLSADDREFLKTGITVEEWNSEFGGGSGSDQEET